MVKINKLEAGGRHDMPPPLSSSVVAEAPCAAEQFPTANTFPRPPLQLPDAPTRRWIKRPRDLDLWLFNLESDVRVTCDVGYLCANFDLLRPLCSRLRLGVSDRQTNVRLRQHHCLIPPIGAGHNNRKYQFYEEQAVSRLILELLR